MTDDRVTLPLTKTRAAAEKMCAAVCTDPWTGEVLPGGHDPTCLTLLLAERDLAMATTYLATSISDACLGTQHWYACRRLRMSLPHPQNRKDAK